MPEAGSPAARARSFATRGEPRRAHGARASRTRRRMLLGAAYVIFGAALFIAFLADMFPYGDTISAMLEPLNLKLVYREQRMHFPIGARLADVRLLSTAGPQYQIVLRSPAVILAPTIASLLLGRPGLRVRAQIYGGTVGATVYQRKTIASIAFTIDSLSLARAEPLRQFGAEFGGAISGAGTAELIENADLSSDTAHLALAGTGVSIKVLDGLPPMRLGAVTGVAGLSDGAITLNDVDAHGDDVAIAARGTIQLAPDLAESVVDLTVSLTPTPAGRDRFGMLINMLPHPPARGPYYIHGPLMSPSVN
jgi:type II secretion system protein N